MRRQQRRPARFAVPGFIGEAVLGRDLADLLHESARPRRAHLGDPLA